MTSGVESTFWRNFGLALGAQVILFNDLEIEIVGLNCVLHTLLIDLKDGRTRVVVRVALEEFLGKPRVEARVILLLQLSALGATNGIHRCELTTSERCRNR